MMKFNVSASGAKEHIVEFMPAIEPLNNHIRYVISQGMTMALSASTKGMAQLLAHSQEEARTPGMYTLEITMSSLQEKESQKLEDSNEDDYLLGELGRLSE